MVRRTLFGIFSFGLWLSLASAQTPSESLDLTHLQARLTQEQTAAVGNEAAEQVLAQAHRALQTGESAEPPSRQRALRIAEAAITLAHEQTHAAEQAREVLRSRQLLDNAEQAVARARERADRAERTLATLNAQAAPSP